MTESTDKTAHAPGWHPDPAGSPRQRWWDGTQWTEHLHDPGLEVYGGVRPSVLGPQTPVYNGFIWTLTLLPLLSIAGLSFFDMSAYAESSMETALSPTATAAPFASADLAYNVLQILGYVLFGASVLLAFFDRRRLLRDGFARPFHWAWTFLGSGVYIIGRSVIVKRRAGRGLALIWVFVALTLASMVVAGIKMFEMFVVLMPLFQAGTTGY